MASYAVGALQLQVALLGVFQERTVVPRGAVVDGRRVCRGRHRSEIAVELLFVHVLRFIDLQQELRAVPHHVRLRLCRHEQQPRSSDANRVSCFDRRDRRKARLHQSRPEPPQADTALRLERRSALDGVDLVPQVDREQQRLDLRRQLVLTTLTGDLYGDASPLSIEHALQDRATRLDLVWTQLLLPRTSLDRHALARQSEDQLCRHGPREQEDQAVDAAFDLVKLMFQRTEPLVDDGPKRLRREPDRVGGVWRWRAKTGERSLQQASAFRC